MRTAVAGWMLLLDEGGFTVPVDLDRITAALDELAGRWPQLLALFAALAAAAGVLGILTRALGEKEADGYKSLFARLAGRRAKQDMPSLQDENKSE